MTREVDQFTQIFTECECWRWQYHGVEIAKHPCDLMVYQQIIWECRPQLIIECGTFSGGSALFMAEQLLAIEDTYGYDAYGYVASIDIEQREDRPDGPFYFHGSSADPQTLAQVRAYWPQLDSIERVMVILDSDHHKDHVLAELALWAPLVTPGQYLIVEDTCINGHPVLPGWGPGPFEALQEWLPQHPEFVLPLQVAAWNPGSDPPRGRDF